MGTEFVPPPRGAHDVLQGPPGAPEAPRRQRGRQEVQPHRQDPRSVRARLLRCVEEAECRFPFSLTDEGNELILIKD